MFQKFYPKEYLDSTYEIPFEKLYEEGYRGVLFDIDNTLVPHGAPPTPEAVAFFERLRKLGFSYCFISNNQKERVESFCREVKGKCVFNAHKPSVKGYELAMQYIGTNKENTLFVGDQLFTDIYGANRTGVRSILVKPIHPKEEIQIVLKRYLEKIVLHYYKKEVRKKKR